MTTLRDMNLSKLIAQDVPLFLSLLGDLFPSVVAGGSGDAHAEVDISTDDLLRCHRCCRSSPQPNVWLLPSHSSSRNTFYDSTATVSFDSCS